jgi:hypothetical protein
MKRSQAHRLGRRAYKSGHTLVCTNKKGGRYAIVPLPAVYVPDWATAAERRYVTANSRCVCAWLRAEELRP